MKLSKTVKQDLIKAIEEAVSFSEKTKIGKIKKYPLKLSYSKFLEFVALKFEIYFPVKAKTFWNGDMLVVIPEPVSLDIYRYGFFEEGLTKMLLEFLKPGMTFFDIGAHFGYFSLFSSYIVGESGNVHSFEPTPSIYDILKTNTATKANITINNKAVASNKKRIFINDYGIKYSAFNSVFDARLPKEIISKFRPKKNEVEAISIDEYVESMGIKPDFIKIDAESSEFEILRGMEKTIARFHPILSLEVGDVGVQDVPESKELLSYLRNRGYQSYEFINGKIMQHKIKNIYTYDNILFLPTKE